MIIKSTRIYLTALSVALASSGCIWLSHNTRAQEATEPLPVTAADTASAEALSKSTQEVYRKIAGSLVRIRMDQPILMLGQPLQKEFIEWRRQQPDFRAPGEKPVRPAATQPANARPNRPFLQRWLEKKIAEENNEEQKKRFQNLLALVNAPVAESMGVVIDNQGDILVFGAGIHDNTSGDGYLTLTVNGDEVRAKYIGSHPARNFALLKLDSPGSITPIEKAAGRPAPGEVLFQVSTRTGSVNVILAPGRFGKKIAEDRFAIPGGEGTVYVFNAKGQLVALGADRFALPADVVQPDIEWILKNGRDIAPLKLGIAYEPVTAQMRSQLKLPADTPAIRVKEVVKGTPADRAGIQTGDILLKINDLPMTPQGYTKIQSDLMTRRGTVSVQVLRNGETSFLAMPLDETLPNTPNK